LKKILLNYLRSYLPVKKISQLKKEQTYYNLTIERIENIIDKTLKELKLNNFWYGKKTSEVNKLDIEILIAVINSIIEKSKAIQLTTLFLSLFFTFLVNFFIVLLDISIIYKAMIYFVFAISILIAAPYIERNYKTTIENYTYLKEILTIYKNHKKFK